MAQFFLNESVLKALMSLFVLSSKDGWVNIMYTGLDAVGVDQQPIENFNEWRLLYFISFLLLVAFFVLNMFVGVVVENFHRCREEQEKEEKALRALKRAQKMEKRRKSKEIKLFINVYYYYYYLVLNFRNERTTILYWLWQISNVDPSHSDGKIFRFGHCPSDWLKRGHYVFRTLYDADGVNFVFLYLNIIIINFSTKQIFSFLFLSLSLSFYLYIFIYIYQ